MLTPEQVQAQDQQIKQLPTIKQLQAKDDEIIEDLESLRAGQVEIDKKVDEGFEKGRRRMDGIEGKVEKLDGKFESFLMMFSNHVQRTEQMHQETRDTIKDNKYQDLKEEKKQLQQQIEDAQKRKWDILKGVGLLVAGAIISAISVKLLG